MALILSRQDDTPVSSIDLTVERGLASNLIDLKIYNNGAEDVIGAFLTIYAENVPGSGTYQSSGHPVTDERMGRFQITGQDTTATPGQQIILGDVQPMGHMALGLLPTIKPGDWILANLWLEQSAASAGGGSVNIKVEIANDSTAYPIPFGVSQVGTGIDSGRKQPRSFLIAGRSTTATGTPDDNVHSAAGSWLVNGEEYADASAAASAFTQNDFNGDTLGVGEAYIAVLTANTTAVPTITLGVKAVAVDAVKPTPPSGEVLIAWVTVRYNVSATTILNTDIEDSRVFGRYKVAAPPTGLSVTVYPGEAIIDSFRQIKSVPEVVSLTASVTNRVWLEWNGIITVTLSDIPPSAGAVKLADVATDGSNCLSNTDRRTYIRPLDPGLLEVKEVSGGVDDVAIDQIVFPDGSLTSLGGGAMQVDFPSVTGKADSSLSVTATEGVQRTAGTDLTSAVEFKLDVAGLDENTTPDTDLDFVPIVDHVDGVHRRVKVGLLGGVSLGSYIVRETPAGTVNGSNTVFTLAFTPAGSGQETVYLNGLIQDGGVLNDYTIAGAVITFNVAPTSGDKIRVTYFKA